MWNWVSRERKWYVYTLWNWVSRERKWHIVELGLKYTKALSYNFGKGICCLVK